MKGVPEVSVFMERAEKDARLGPLHISLYMSILYCWLRKHTEGAVCVTGRELMPIAKIGGLTPMYRTLKELDEYGYIDYKPSHSLSDKSRIYLPLLRLMNRQAGG